MWPVLLLTFVIAVILYLDVKKPKNFPPGPRWFPIAGCGWELNKVRRETGSLARAVEKLASKYGPVIGAMVGADRLVFVHGFAELREFSAREEFSGRPDGVFYTSRTWGKRRGLVFTDSKFWEVQRTFAMKELKQFGFGRRSMSEIIEEEGRVMVENVRKKIGVLRMDNLFGIYVLNTLWIMIVGTKYDPEDAKVKNLQFLITNLMTKVNMDGALFSHFPILRHICPNYSGYREFVDTHEKLFTFIYEEVEKAKETFNSTNFRSFIDVYLNAISERKGSFSEAQLMAVCADFFIAGTETTTKTLSFAFFYLTLNPNIQKKAQKEIDEVVGRLRLPTIKDRQRLKYVECIVLESLRMFASNIVAVPHRALKNTHFNGFFIPKDTIMLGSLRGGHLDKNWINPEAFEPERFIKGGHVQTPENYFPFGLGKRKCLGDALARANIFLFVACLLQRFNFSICPSDPPSDELTEGMLPGPKPFVAMVTAR